MFALYHPEDLLSIVFVRLKFERNLTENNIFNGYSRNIQYHRGELIQHVTHIMYDIKQPW